MIYQIYKPLWFTEEPHALIIAYFNLQYTENQIKYQLMEENKRK